MKLSYAAADLGLGARSLVRIVEVLTGGHRIAQVGARFKATEPQDEVECARGFYRRAAKAFRLRVTSHAHSVGMVPATGGLLVVANHPFGVIDGLAVAALVETVRQDMRIVVWDAIRIPERYQKHYIPLDLDEDSRAARRQNARARREMINHLSAGGSLLLFPSGTAAIAEDAFSEPEEAQWTPMMARIARASQATVLPVFIGGENSRLFHVITRFSLLMRRALFLRETALRIGDTVKPVVGEPVPWSTHSSLAGDDVAATELMREQVLALNPDTEERRPVEKETTSLAASDSEPQVVASSV